MLHSKSPFCSSYSPMKTQRYSPQPMLQRGMARVRILGAYQTNNASVMIVLAAMLLGWTSCYGESSSDQDAASPCGLTGAWQANDPPAGYESIIQTFSEDGRIKIVADGSPLPQETTYEYDPQFNVITIRPVVQGEVQEDHLLVKDLTCTSLRIQNVDTNGRESGPVLAFTRIE